jgi:hypothetical protein
MSTILPVIVDTKAALILNTALPGTGWAIQLLGTSHPPQGMQVQTCLETAFTHNLRVEQTALQVTPWHAQALVHALPEPFSENPRFA